MNGLPYYKRYPRDFMEGAAGMSFEIKGAYAIILDLIYLHGGELPDDPRYIAGQLSLSVRKWNSIKNQLVESGKISVTGDFLTNYRSIIELESLRKYQDKQAENASGPRKNKDLEKPWHSHTDTDTDKNDDDKARGDQTFREKILVACGVDPVSGFTGLGGAMLGTPADMIEAGRWVQDLKLSEPQVLEQVAHVMSRKKNGPPSSLRYFSKSMQEFAGKVSGAKSEIMVPVAKKVDLRNPKIDDEIEVNGITKRYAGNGVGWVKVHG